MTNVDELDRIWQEGLTTAAEEFATPGDIRVRVAARVRRRRRSRRVSSACGAAVVVAVGVIAVGLLPHDGSAVVATVPVTTAPPVPVAVVQVDEAPRNQLEITFPGRVSGAATSLSLPPGLIRFVVHVGGAGHVLRIDGAPAFEVDANVEGETIAKDVELEPGTYVMYCAVPGHREAGERMTLVVG